MPPTLYGATPVKTPARSPGQIHAETPEARAAIAEFIRRVGVVTAAVRARNEAYAAIPRLTREGILGSGVEAEAEPA